ncbi:hypothetical protein YC2023_091720 [Brassica napus]
MATPPPDQPVESAEHPSTFYLTYYNLKIFSGEMDRYELMVKFQSDLKIICDCLDACSNDKIYDPTETARRSRFLPLVLIPNNLPFKKKIRRTQVVLNENDPANWHLVPKEDKIIIT